MREYLIRRLFLSLVTVFGVTVVIFLTMRVLPGDPIAIIFGEGTGVYVLSEDELKAARKSLGLDRPLYRQYSDWMADVFKGDLGYSFWLKRPVRETIQRRGPITAEIAVIAVMIS
ncbi:MAG: ABC transporter permease, partial [Bacillota bacterium]|nr:ABC transporter permease [Bacillota bacterium]